MTDSEAPDRRPRWRSPRAAVIALSLGAVVLAERDIHNRAPDEVRGSKLLWRLISLNALGALAYLKWGRSRQAES